MQIKDSANGHPPLIISVVGPHGCWVPNRTNKRNGYIKVSIGGRSQLLHRYIYEQVVGPIPPGDDLHHAVCENKPCCNPMHVQPLPKPEHIHLHRTANHPSRTHCPQGHAYEGDNLIVAVSKQGYPQRNCRECHREAGRERSRLFKQRRRERELLGLSVGIAEALMTIDGMRSDLV